MFFIFQLITAEYVYQDILNRCNTYNISGEHCKNSIYMPRKEYDDYVRSFNLPVQKAPECNNRECKIVVYKDPPRIVINNTSLGQDFCLQLGQNHPLCKNEDMYKYIAVPTPPQNLIMTLTESKTVTETNPITIREKQKILTKTLNQTTTVTETRSDVKSIDQQPKTQETVKTVTEYKTLNVDKSIQPQTSNNYEPEIKIVTKNEIRTIMVEEDQRIQRPNSKFKDPLDQPCQEENNSNRRSYKKPSFIYDEARSDIPSKSKDNYITLIRYKTVTKTEEAPITLYRETVKTITKEKPIVNFKVTTVTEIESVTKTTEKQITVTESMTKTITSTSISEKSLFITQSISPTISPVTITVFPSSTSSNISSVPYKSSITTNTTPIEDVKTITKEIPTTVYINKTVPKEIETSTAIAPIVDEIMKIIGQKEDKTTDIITKTKTIYKTETIPEEKKQKTVINTVYEYKKKARCRINIKQYPGNKFGCSEDGQKIILKTVYIKPQAV